jgi:hypothetical protein
VARRSGYEPSANALRQHTGTADLRPIAIKAPRQELR